ncbi:hypothetical protein Q7C36_013924 [Tachysurus vachellii]|uniref:Uncharacterized protein n=1 Tax=Tachysurus vachellii TaxID=175792 RepID=A0AA88MIR9_TACVA|nr:hypothetical protein Q7C36_013924 [Tachysurus vachellii]
MSPFVSVSFLEHRPRLRLFPLISRGDGPAVYEETRGEKCHFNDSGHMHDGICCSGHVVRQERGRGTERRMKRKTNVGQMEFLIWS